MIISSLGEARVRGAAIQLAQDRIEIARNLAYERVGTQGGIPEGDLLPHETINRSGADFTVDTAVLYVDDEYDGTAPSDLIPTDYKRVRVNVVWKGAFSSKKPVVLVADISPQGIEQDGDGGTISLLVFDALGQPVDNAFVQIEAPTLSPPILIDTYTDTQGRLSVPGAPVCNECYAITVSKTGYSTEQTYSRTEIANPQKPHLSVMQSRVTEASFAIDRLAALTVRATRSQQAGYSVFAGANVVITGSKLLGTSALGDPVYKTTKSAITGASGTVTISDLEWDQYTLSVPPSSSIDVGGSWPFNPFAVDPGTSPTVSVIVEGASDNTYLVQLKDNTNLPLSSASAELKRPGFIATDSAGAATMGDWSQAFFKNLTPGSYDLTIRADGFEQATASVSIAGEKQDMFTLLKIAGP